MSCTLSQKAIALLDGLEQSDDACCSWDFTTIREALIKLQKLEDDTTTTAQEVER